MAIKLDYVARETATNLTRNITLTLASILTVVVSLTLAGSAWMLNQGVHNANDRFKGGLEQWCDHVCAGVETADVRESFPAKSVSSNKSPRTATMSQRQSFWRFSISVAWA